MRQDETRRDETRLRRNETMLRGRKVKRRGGHGGEKKLVGRGVRIRPKAECRAGARAGARANRPTRGRKQARSFKSAAMRDLKMAESAYP